MTYVLSIAFSAVLKSLTSSENAFENTKKMHVRRIDPNLAAFEHIFVLLRV
jgi:hypothetical protein